jgi:hypothetical protein
MNMSTGNSSALPFRSSELGLSPKEVRAYSFDKLLRNLAAIMGGGRESSFELECGKAIGQRLKRAAAEGYEYVPFEILCRDLSASGSGAPLVDTTNVPTESFIGALHNASITEAMGVRTLEVGPGYAAFPKVATGQTAYWIPSESTQITEGQPTFVQLPSSPKSLATYTELSPLLTKQTGDVINRFVLPELGAQLAQGKDAAIIAGSGANGQPQGVIGTAGVGSATGTSLNVAGLADMMGDPEAANAVVNQSARAFAVAPDVALLLRKRVGTGASRYLMEGDAILDSRGFVSNSVTAASAIFGDWSSVIFCSWGGLQISTNPYANFQAGITGVRAIWSCDVVVRHPGSFSIASSIT